MRRQITGVGAVAQRRRLSPSRIFFPRALREAIPDLPTCFGRDLELDSMTGRQSKTPWFGPRVQLNLIANETGKLTGELVVQIDLSVDAARTLAQLLTQLAEK
jgi:hypothetical protein